MKRPSFVYRQEGRELSYKILEDYSREKGNCQCRIAAHGRIDGLAARGRIDINPFGIFDMC